jgi:hypothetical protein
MDAANAQGVRTPVRTWGIGGGLSLRRLRCSPSIVLRSASRSAAESLKEEAVPPPKH